MSDEPLDFEDAMSRLERIVTELESGSFSLEESIRKFEEGIALGKKCREFLARADLRVRTLVDAREETPRKGDETDGG
jgi:exodeoxyribonuclease VII small subunit